LIRRLFVWLPVAALLAALGWVLLLVYPRATPGGANELLVLSWNVHGLNYEGEEASAGLIWATLEALRPDLLLLQEMSFGKRGGPLLKRLADELGLEHQARFPYGDDRWSGTAIAARHPLQDIELLPLPPLASGRTLGLARLEVGGRPLQVGVLHLANADIHLFGKRASLLNELVGENLRTLQLGSVLKRLQGFGGEPLLLGGDLNTFPLSAGWRMLRAEYHDAFRLPQLLHGTFRLKGEIEVKLDHIFLSPQVESLEARVLDAAGSDHRPVLARIRY
jgi:endonuclease/exonuclease/phosphatase family metal-dependent hydrolase